MSNSLARDSTSPSRDINLLESPSYLSSLVATPLSMSLPEIA